MDGWDLLSGENAFQHAWHIQTIVLLYLASETQYYSTNEEDNTNYNCNAHGSL